MSCSGHPLSPSRYAHFQELKGTKNGENAKSVLREPMSPPLAYAWQLLLQTHITYPHLHMIHLQKYYITVTYETLHPTPDSTLLPSLLDQIFACQSRYYPKSAARCCFCWASVGHTWPPGAAMKPRMRDLPISVTSLWHLVISTQFKQLEKR